MDVVPGHLLDDRYRVGPLVGSGGMASVHIATDVRLCRDVALKLFHPPVDEIAMARLAAEARMLAGLSHPGLIKVFDVCMEAEQPYLVMQLVSGCTLRTVINRGPLGPRQVARLGARLAETVRYVHSRQVVHRDIKPSNVLLDKDGVGYLADFGIAKAVGAAQLTASGHCVGTAAYLAPEQVSGADVEPAADIYSLGLVLLESLTGRAEFTGTEVEAAIARLSRSPRVPEWIPPALRRVLIAMTRRDPGDRPDAASCVSEFQAYVENPDADPASRTPTVITAPVVKTLTRSMKIPLRRWRPMHAAASLVVLAAAVTGVLLLSGDAHPAAPAQQPPTNPGVAPVVAVVPETAAGQVNVPEQQQQQQQRNGKKKHGKSRNEGG